MTDTTTPTPDASGTPAQIATSSATANPNSIDSLPESWQKEIKALRAENAERRKATEKAETDARAAEEARLAEQGNYKAIAERQAQELETLRAAAAKAEAYEKQAAETLKRRIDALPEHVRGAVPEYDDPLKVIGWLDANAAVLSLPTPPPTDAGVRGAVPAVIATQQQSTMAQLAAQYGHNIKPEDVAKRAKALEQSRRTNTGE